MRVYEQPAKITVCKLNLVTNILPRREGMALRGNCWYSGRRLRYVMSAGGAAFQHFLNLSSVVAYSSFLYACTPAAPPPFCRMLFS